MQYAYVVNFWYEAGRLDFAGIFSNADTMLDTLKGIRMDICRDEVRHLFLKAEHSGVIEREFIGIWKVEVCRAPVSWIPAGHVDNYWIDTVMGVWVSPLQKGVNYSITVCDGYVRL